LSGNELSGSIPPEIGNLTKLTFLNLTNNNFSGNIPPEIENLSYVVILWLDFNQLTGRMPPWLSNLDSLSSLQIHDNQLNGCYDPLLTKLCTQLDPTFNDNNGISDGNNFDAPWEEFCAIGVQACTYNYSSELKVYPIPAEDVVVFEVPHTVVADEIVLYDIRGREINRQAFPADKQLAVSDLAGGVYIYRIFYEDDMYSGKIVVK